MFSEFPQTLRRYGIDADIRVIMDMYRTMEMGIVTNLGSLVPNLTLTTQRGGNAVAGGIRGTGSISILVTEDPSVAFLVDDFGLNHVQSQFVEMFDIEQIEVYRGPQGTLFGKN